MVRIGDFSLELCGGTHVRSTGEIGAFDLLSESGIAAGVRRSEALTGAGAERAVRQRRQVLAELGSRLNAAPEELADKIEALLGRNRQLERSLDELRRRVAALETSDLSNGAREVEGVRVVARRTEAEDVPSLRAMADGLRESLGTGVGVLGGGYWRQGFLYRRCYRRLDQGPWAEGRRHCARRGAASRRLGWRQAALSPGWWTRPRQTRRGR